MAIYFTTLDEVTTDPVALAVVQKWLDRGDGIAVYENKELGHPELGHRKLVSFGSPAAQFEGDQSVLPERLPDMGNEINWRYWLVGYYGPPCI